MQAAAAHAPGTGSWWTRARLLDVAPVVAIVFLAGLLDVSDRQMEHAGVREALLGAVVAVPLLWRRRYPLPVFCVVALAIIGVANAIPYPSIVAGLVAAYSVAAYDARWWLSLGAVGVVAAMVTIAFPGPVPPIPAVLGPFLLLVAPWVAGNAVRLREQRMSSAEMRALQLEHERDEAELVLGEERNRIARELHDVVAHSVGVMVVQAGAARQVLHSKPERATEALLAVEEEGRQALNELRHLLGLLTDSGESPLAPHPGLDDLPALVDRVRSAGLPVVLRVEGRSRRLPPGADLAAYRIVQEALTNALKHSGRAQTEVTVSYAADELRLAILDGGAGAASATLPAQRSAGRGLLGMRERVALYGGTLDAGPRAGGGYAVNVRLPIATPAG